MAHLELSHVDYFLDDGRQLLHDVSLRLGEGERRALIGANGVGKTTLLRLLAGEIEPHQGLRSSSGKIGVMKQLVGQVRDETTVADLLLGTSTSQIAAAAWQLRVCEDRMIEIDDERSQLAYAEALITWGDVGGHNEEVRWDDATTRVLGLRFEQVAHRPVATLSGGEQKRLVLAGLASGPHDILILDEPDNYLDIAGKKWLESLICDVPKSVLLVSHDREVVARAATSVITLERGRAGATAWVHGGSYATYADARRSRNERIDELRRRWYEDEQRLKDQVRMYREKSIYNSDMAKRYHAAQSRLQRFRVGGPPEAPVADERLSIRLKGGRTAKRAVVCTNLTIPGIIDDLSTEIWYGDRVAVLGSNGTGKSHLLRLLALQPAQDESLAAVTARTAGLSPIEYSGGVTLGARVRSGYFVQTHNREDLEGRTLLEVLQTGIESRAGLDRSTASGALNRYGLVTSAETCWEHLSGGQRARFQVLLLELEGATLLLLDEPTDNLDIDSAETLEAALAGFDGTVIAVTHDRWFARSFNRFLVIGDDGRVTEPTAPPWSFFL